MAKDGGTDALGVQYDGIVETPMKTTPPHIPSQNVLDLRQTGTPQPVREPSRDTLSSFWKKKPATVVAPVRRSRPRVSRPVLHAASYAETWSTFVMQVRAILSRYSLGAFPVVAVALVAVFGAVAVYGNVARVKDRVMAYAQQGYTSLKIAGAKAESKDLTSAQSALQDAAGSFASAQQTLDTMNPVLRGIAAEVPFIGSKLKSGEHLVAAAKDIADAGSSFAGLATPLTVHGEGFSSVAGMLKNLTNDQHTLDSILANVSRATDELSHVRAKDLPDQYQDQVTRIQQMLPGLKASLTNVSSGVSVLTDLFGVHTPSESLFIFQNSNELRPTGGFIGSFALIRMDNGSFKMLDAPSRGSFDIDQNMPSTIAPPKPLQLLVSNWYFRDANWFPDFPTSAQQLSQMYEQARGFAPRTIVAFTPQLIQQLLAITGPVELPAYKVTIDEHNFASISQQQVEQNYDLRANNPKQFIVDLIPTLADRLSNLSVGQYPQLAAAFARSAMTGDIQLWSSDSALQKSIVSLGWSGTMPSSDGDFVELVNTNLGGGKTDGVMSDAITDHVTVAPDGTVTVTVEDVRTHHGTSGDAFTGSMNRTYHRLYVPLGSTLISTQGFTPIAATEYQTVSDSSKPTALLTSVEGNAVVNEATGTRITTEFGKTVFGNWTELQPGQTATFSITYQLPFKVVAGINRYDLVVGKQAGAQNQTFALDLKLPDNGSVAWTSFVNSSSKKKTASFTADLTSPFSLSLVLQRKEK